jgi:outer membrane protein assembly factor BamB
MKILLTLAALALFAPMAPGQDVKPFTFVHISDTHMNPGATKHDENLKAAVDEFNAATPRPAFVIHTGDITEMGQTQQFALYKDDIKAAKMPFYNSPGNHETRWADQSINRFKAELGSPNISFKHNGVRFIGFNAAIWLEHHGAVSGDTRRWIVSELAKDPKGTPAVLFCHQPPMYPDNVFVTGDVELWQAIAPYNVRLFLNGHGHIFKSWTVNGVFLHMTKGMMNDEGGYTIFEFGADDIKAYEKLNGGERKLVATLPMRVEPTKIDLRFGGTDRMTGAIRLYAATLTVPHDDSRTVARVEYLVDAHQRPNDVNWTAVPAATGARYPFSINTKDLSPGKHTLSVRAVDREGRVWVHTEDLPTLSTSPKARVFNADTALQGPSVADDSAVFVGGWDGKLYAIDRKTMAPRWTFKTGGAVIGRPDVDDAAVYFGSTDESVYAVSKKNGKQLWKFATKGPIQGHSLVTDGAVFVGSGDHNLYAIDAATGKERWRYAMDMHAQARPAYGDGTIYVGAWDNTFYALDARTGALKWKKAIGPSIFFSPAVSSPCLVDGKIITTAAVVPRDTESPHVLCLDAKTGETVWGYRLPAGSSAYASPTSDGKSVFLSTLDGELYALDLATGKRLWSSQMGEIAYDCSPVFHDGQVICNTLMGSVEGHDAATGEKLWSYKTGGGLTFAWPTVIGNDVYQPSFDGTLTEISINEK